MPSENDWVDAKWRLTHEVKALEAQFAAVQDGERAAYLVFGRDGEPLSRETEGYNDSQHTRRVPYVRICSGDGFLCDTADGAIDAWKVNFSVLCHATNKSTLYWRTRPELEYGDDLETGKFGWKVYCRAAVVQKSSLVWPYRLEDNPFVTLTAEDVHNASRREREAVEAILILSRYIRDKDGNRIRVDLPAAFALAVVRAVGDTSPIGFSEEFLSADRASLMWQFPMSSDVLKEHSETIRKIATDFDAEKVSGAGEVAFLLRRVARLMEGITHESDADRPSAA